MQKEPQIPQVKWLEPYFKVGEEIAKASPCTRRQYGAVIVVSGPEIYYQTAFNKRIGRCCGGSCIRDRFGFANGERVEIGGEIHAETAALINFEPDDIYNAYFILVGFLSNGTELLGRSVWPCHMCAMNIAFAGFKYIYIRNTNGIISPVSIYEIIEGREQEWERID